MTCVESSNEAYLRSLSRVQSYPIVNDSLVLALSSYQWLKSKNSIIDNTLSRAEQALKTIKDAAEPIVAKRLGSVDNVVYNQLERLEKRCPIILEPSSTIGNIPSKVYHDINQRYQSTFGTMLWPVTKTFDVAKSVVETSFKIPSTMVSYYVIGKSEELLDKYLPDPDTPSEESNKPDIYSKVKRLSSKTKRRLYKKALEKIDLLHKASLEKLEKIKSVMEDLQSKKDSLKNSLIEDYSIAIESIKGIPSNLSKHSDLIKDVIHYSKSIQEALSSSVSSSMEYVLNATVASLSYLNGNLLKLQNLLNEVKPDFISSDVIGLTNTVITEIRKGMDSLTANIKEYLKHLFHDEDNTDSTDANETSEVDEHDYPNTNGGEEESCDSDD